MDNKRVMSTYLLQSLIPFNTLQKQYMNAIWMSKLSWHVDLKKGERMIWDLNFRV